MINNDLPILSNQDLERGYWWLKHQALIKKISLVLGVLILLSLYAWLIFAYIRYFQSGQWENYAQALNNQSFD